MLFFTYILISERVSRFYYGQTQNLTKRIKYHNSGKVISTRSYIPWKVFAYKTCDSRAEAMKFEKMLKNLHSREKVMAFVNRHNFSLIDDI
ncbi:MAG: GIY-YIG nuclease family protein [Bacteroidales bacterium]|nr:GIY-YIG nuclease family protein [Bacteroidales bacterium]